MPLFQLPPEILLQVMDYVGPSYYFEDLGRLTVCKQWFAYAQAILFKNLQLHQTTLRRLMSSPHVRSILRIKDNLECLDLKLKGFEDWRSVPGDQHYPSNADALSASVWEGSLGQAVLSAWTADLNADLAQLAKIANASRKLRILRFQAFSEGHHLVPDLPRRDYLAASTIQDMLLAKTLTILELDTCGSQLMFQREHAGEIHICKVISNLLITLQRLRLRMRSICADALRPPHANATLPLSEVLINLSLSNESSFVSSATHSTPCGSTSGGVAKLKENMEHQAGALVLHLESPRVVRILSHSFPHLEMHSLDVLTGRRMKLADSMGWEDDGEVIEEMLDSESEEMDGFSTSSEEW